MYGCFSTNVMVVIDLRGYNMMLFGGSVALRPQKAWGLLGTGAQDVHLDFHTAPELCMMLIWERCLIVGLGWVGFLILQIFLLLVEGV